jgi:hypothetical protein
VPPLARSILSSIEQGRYLVTDHADERLRERGILLWQVLEGVGRPICTFDDPGATPFPKSEIDFYLVDGTRVRSVWSWSRASGTARLVTIHFR